MFIRCGLLCLGLALLPIGGARAQTSLPHEIHGELVDPSDSAVVDVEVVLSSRDGERSERTSIDGGFRFADLLPGEYRLSVSVDEFAPIERVLKVGRRPLAPLRLRLTLATLRQEVSVDETDRRVNTNIGGDLGAVALDRSLLADLPFLGLDYIQALSGFLDPLDTGGTSLVVDGMEMRNVGVTASAIEEVRINQNPYTAEYPRWSRRRIEVITKSTADAFHGTLNVLYRDHRLNAREPFARARPPEQRQTLEGSLFGPLGNGKRTSFLASALRENDDLQAVVFARRPEGLVVGNFPAPQRNTFSSLRVSRKHSDRQSMFVQANFQDRWRNNQRVGGTTLPEAGTQTRFREDELVFNHSLVLTPKLLSQFRIMLGRYGSPTRSNLREPAIVVSGSFVGGGAQADSLRTEVHTSIVWLLTQTSGAHTFKYGLNVPDWSRRGLSDRTNDLGAFQFASLDDYVAGRPFAAVLQQGDPRTVFVEKNVGAFVQDDWRVNSRLSMAFGLRYDWQNFFRDRDNVAPRAALAYGFGESRKTVLRVGAGLFFDRSGPGPIWDILRYDGAQLRRFVLSRPDPPPYSGPVPAPTSVARLEPEIELPTVGQFSFGVERQLGRETTLAVSYVGVRGWNQLRSRDGNAPLPPGFGERPDASLNVLRWIESASRVESNALEVMVRGLLAPRLKGLAQYAYGKTLADTGGVNWFPADSFRTSGEWGRTDTDRRHRFTLMGSATLHRWFNLGVSASFQSGLPFNVTTGRDENGDGLAIDRPPGVSRNAGQGPGYASIDLRWFRRFALRPDPKNEGPALTVAVDAFNVFNRTNFDNYVGALTSPFFGRSVASLPARRLQLSLRFEF